MIVKRKRVIVADARVSSYTPDKDAWLGVMRGVSAKHFSNLKNIGPAWTFASNQLQTFSDLVRQLHPSLPEEQEILDDEQFQTKEEDEEQCQEEEEQCQINDAQTQTDEQPTQDDPVVEQCQTNDAQTQTDEQPTQDDPVGFCYKHDITDDLKAFVSAWLEDKVR